MYYFIWNFKLSVSLRPVVAQGHKRVVINVTGFDPHSRKLYIKYFHFFVTLLAILPKFVIKFLTRVGLPCYMRYTAWKHKWKKINSLHAVSRTQQSRQKEPRVKTLRSLFSAEFWRHCVLSGRAQLRALPRHQSEETKIYI